MGKALQGERVIKCFTYNIHYVILIYVLWLLFQLPVHAYIVKIGYIGNFRSFRGFSGLLFSKLRLTEIKN